MCVWGGVKYSSETLMEFLLVDCYYDYLLLFQATNKEESGNAADTWNDNEEELFDTLGTNMKNINFEAFYRTTFSKKKIFKEGKIYVLSAIFMFLKI